MNMNRTFSYAVAGLTVLLSFRGGRAEDFGNRSATIWHYEEWQVDNPSWEGNAFDVVATVTATHSGGAQRVFEMFYDGGTTWKFRFTGDIVGDWSLSTSSDDTDLDGHSATVSVAAGDADAPGFSTAEGNKYAWQVGNDGDMRAQIRRVYTDQRAWFWAHENPSEDLTDYFKPQLDDAIACGFDAVWMCFRHCWFEWGAWKGSEHDSEEPDLTVFRMLEKHIQEVHARGLSLDIRMWGDKGHDWSAASLPGGINGYVDRRLQRYIAARLGALPGWGLSYAYDLEEFMDNGKCDAWADYLNERFAWPHLIWTRRFFDGISVTVASNDDRPGSADNAYNDARNRLSGSGNRPVLFERNFNRGRDGVWDDNTTLQSLWAFVMAGGASAHWTSEEYEPEWQNRDQLKTHGRFWVDNRRFLLDMEPRNELSGDNTWVLVSESSQSLVAYRRGTSEITVDLSGFSPSLPAIAVDTRKSYEEVNFGTVPAENHTFNFESSSDWAVAVGDFDLGTGRREPMDKRVAGTPGNILITEAAGGVRIDGLDGNADISVFNMAGRNLMRIRGGSHRGNSTLPRSMIRGAVYLLNIREGGRARTYRICVP